MYWNYWFSPCRVREPEEGGGEVTAREKKGGYSSKRRVEEGEEFMKGLEG